MSVLSSPIAQVQIVFTMLDGSERVMVIDPFDPSDGVALDLVVEYGRREVLHSLPYRAWEPDGTVSVTLNATGRRGTR